MQEMYRTGFIQVTADAFDSSWQEGFPWTISGFKFCMHNQVVNNLVRVYNYYVALAKAVQGSLITVMHLGGKHKKVPGWSSSTT
jgi:hypothetical protein